MIIQPKEKYKAPFYESGAPIFFSDYARKVSMLTGHSVEDIMEIVSAFFLVSVDEFLRKSYRKIDKDDKERREHEWIVPGLGSFLMRVGGKERYLSRFHEFHPTRKIRKMFREGLFKGKCPVDSLMEKEAGDVVKEKREFIVMEEKR